MADAKLWDYEVVLQRKVNNIASTLTLVIKASNRRKAVSIAESTVNRSLPNKNGNQIMWRTKKASLFDDTERSPLRDTD
jgi:hypothetical protein